MASVYRQIRRAIHFASSPGAVRNLRRTARTNASQLRSFSVAAKRLPAGGEADSRSESEGWAYGGIRQSLETLREKAPTPPVGYAADRPASEAVFLAFGYAADRPASEAVFLAFGYAADRPFKRAVFLAFGYAADRPSKGAVFLGVGDFLK